MYEILECPALNFKFLIRYINYRSIQKIEQWNCEFDKFLNYESSDFKSMEEDQELICFNL